MLDRKSHAETPDAAATLSHPFHFRCGFIKFQDDTLKNYGEESQSLMWEFSDFLPWLAHFPDEALSPHFALNRRIVVQISVEQHGQSLQSSNDFLAIHRLLIIAKC